MIQRRLAAILVADVVGYSKLVGSDEAGTLAKLAAPRGDIIEPTIGKHSGRLFKSVGDGFLVEFASAVQAVTCAVEIQNTKPALPLRIGIHVGAVVVQGDDLMGDGVNIAARIEGTAEPGGIAISRQVHDQVRDKLDLGFEDKGEVALKNLSRPVHVFSVRGVKSSPAPVLALPDKPSIAVLPFQNMSGDPEQEFFTDGVSEDIITELSRFRALFVIARNSTFTYKGKAIDVRQVSRELGVQYVLEGSVRKAGNRVRVTAQLIEALNGRHIWAERFDKSLDDIFQVQDEITGHIVSAVGGEVERALLTAIKRVPPNDLHALELGLRAWALVRDFKLRANEVNFDLSTNLAEKALAIDGQCRPALLALAQARWIRALFRIGASPTESLAESLKLADRAEDIDHLDHRSHMIKAWAYLAMARHDDALSEAGRAHDLNPNDPDTLTILGAVEARMGRTTSATERLLQALRLNPLSQLQHMVHLNLGVTCFLAQDYAKGVEWGLKCKRAAPEFVQNLLALTNNYVGLGRLEEARREFETANRLAPDLLKERLAVGSPLYKLPEDRERDATFLRIAAGLERPM